VAAPLVVAVVHCLHDGRVLVLDLIVLVPRLVAGIADGTLERALVIDQGLAALSTVFRHAHVWTTPEPENIDSFFWSTNWLAFVVST